MGDHGADITAAADGKGSGDACALSQNSVHSVSEGKGASGDGGVTLRPSQRLPVPDNSAWDWIQRG